jgi:hypothetical protein
MALSVGNRGALFFNRCGEHCHYLQDMQEAQHPAISYSALFCAAFSNFWLKCYIIFLSHHNSHEIDTTSTTVNCIFGKIIFVSVTCV